VILVEPSNTGLYLVRIKSEVGRKGNFFVTVSMLVMVCNCVICGLRYSCEV